MAAIDRRDLLARGLRLLALPALATLPLGGCARRAGTAGVEAIRWGREACSGCGMAIGDPRYAVQLLGGPGRRQWNFDDIGCAVIWLDVQQEIARELAVFRVAAFDSTLPAPRWLAAQAVFYLPGHRSPMGYDQAATDRPTDGALDFQAMRAAVRARAMRSAT